MHRVHFEELSSAWEANRRIPTHASRRAWAEARNLDARNVHNWWYRRRKLAKRWRISIPRDQYDIDVGTPPTIPEAEPKVEPPTDGALLADSVKDSVTDLSSPPGYASSDLNADITGSSDTLCSASRHKVTRNSKKRAYMRSSSPLDRLTTCSPTVSDDHLTSSPLSLSRSSSPICSPGFLALYPEDYSIPTATTGISCSSFGSS
ncbi:unnamed protein product [Cyclocybe aegerita]|uniref:Homeobox domain-containing protein n=1 Tax=Cyclocybe aegerita TaxID=1973307 RepID=A0A8S0VS86_CYCAE|nr:unnamed protein product [Cyclocybe aegerita]